MAWLCLVWYTRIPIVKVSAGWDTSQQGIIDDSHDPERTCQALLNDVLAQTGVKSCADVKTIKDGDNRVIATRHLSLSPCL